MTLLHQSWSATFSPMAASMRYLCVVVLCSIILGGESQPCSLNNLKVTQSARGKLVQNKPEWKVTIKNDCECSQSSIVISSPGFQSLEKIDPSSLRKYANGYLVNNGNTISEFSFTYAWATQFTFKPVSSQIACS